MSETFGILAWNLFVKEKKIKNLLDFSLEGSIDFTHCVSVC